MSAADTALELTRERALPGRDVAMPGLGAHAFSGRAIEPPFPDGMRLAHFAMGCFWGAERLFWQLPGVHVTAVGYCGGVTPNPNYREVCSGLTGHTEAMRVVYDPERAPFERLLECFWQGHDPTQGMRQGNDVGTQYRSGIYTDGDAQQGVALASRDAFQQRLRDAGYSAITTEIVPLAAFYYAEDAHQQYLAKHPGGYCGLGGLRLPPDGDAP